MQCCVQCHKQFACWLASSDFDFALMTWPGVFTMDLHGVGCCDVNSESSKFQASILSGLYLNFFFQQARFEEVH